MRSRFILTCTVALLATGSVAQARTASPSEGISVSLGQVNGILYYLPRPEGYRVVATLATRPEQPAMRFIATLQPGQTMTLSVPHGVGQPADAVDIRRDGDRLEVHSTPATPPTD